MSKIIFSTAILSLFFMDLCAQDLNWRSVQPAQKHFIALRFGADYGTVAGLSYGRRLPGKRPVFLTADWSLPFGKSLMDDWKVRVSVQRELWHGGRFSLGFKPGFILRRFDSDMATLLNTSVDVTAAFGYYRPKWAFAAKANYDQTLATHVKHHFLQENYPGIYNGWISATGGNFKFGLHSAHAFGKNTLSLEVGKVYARNFEDNPTLPFYFDLSFMRHFSFPNRSQ